MQGEEFRVENGMLCIEITNIDKCNQKKKKPQTHLEGNRFGFNEHQIRSSKMN